MQDFFKIHRKNNFKTPISRKILLAMTLMFVVVVLIKKKRRKVQMLNQTKSLALNIFWSL